MRVKAIQSFIGKVSMNIDDEREIINEKLAKDLIRAGYVIELKSASNKKNDPNPKTNKKKTNKNKK